MLSALESLPSIAGRLENRKLALLLDYDGTLTPIVRRPEDAVIPEAMRSLLEELARRATVAIVSGRDLRDVERMVAVQSLVYAGSHGFDIEGPGTRMEHEEARRALPELDAAERELLHELGGIDGARVERKRFAIAVHYREVEDQEAIERLERAVDEVRRRHASLRRMAGKKVLELQPDVPWDKGRAVLWLLEALGLDGPDVLVIYIGDDVTDEDALRALRHRDSAFGVRVGEPPLETAARYSLRDPAAVQQFLEGLRNRLDGPARPPS